MSGPLDNNPIVEEVVTFNLQGNLRGGQGNGLNDGTQFCSASTIWIQIFSVDHIKALTNLAHVLLLVAIC